MNNEFCARSGKISYKSMNDAQKVIARTRETGVAKVQLKSYRCIYCKQHHLTSMTHPRKKVVKPT